MSILSKIIQTLKEKFAYPKVDDYIDIFHQYTYHTSRTFLVSGQAQQGFNFFSPSPFASTFAELLPIV